jgi:uncharacterized protein YggE
MNPFAALTFGLAVSLAAGSMAHAEGGTITVTGEATVQATPDMATIMLGVTTDGETAVAAMKANNDAVSAVLERLKAAGVDERDLQTSNLSLNPNWVGYDSGSMPTIAGYSAMNMLNVRVRDLAKLGDLLDASITDGANTLNGISFEVSAPRPVMDEARKLAVADAKARAELLATAAGETLGAVVSIVETPNYASPMPMFRSDAASAEAVPLASGQVGLMATVTVTYDLND